MSAAAIELVTLALRDRIAEALTDPGVTPAGKPAVFVGPLDAPGAQDQRVVLFLHRIATNAELRNQIYRQRSAEGSEAWEVHERAVPLDLHFLITSTQTPESTQTRDLASLRDLGRIVLALHEQPLIAGRIAGGQASTLILEQLSAEDLSRLWSLFPTVNCRTSLTYLLSPVWLVPATSPPGAPVVEEIYGTRTRVGA